MKTPARSIVGALLLMATASRAASAPAETGLLAHGTAEMYWVGRIEPDDRGAVRTVIQVRRIAADAKWKAIAQLSGRVVSLTSRGTQAAALLESGQWMLLWDGGSSVGSTPADGAKLVQFAGDSDELWAIAAAGLGRRAATTQALTQPAATLPADSLLLYQLRRGQWEPVAPLPEYASAKRIAGVSLAIFQSAPMVAVLDEQGKVRTATWTAHHWHDLGAIGAGAAARDIRLLMGLSMPTLWLGTDGGGAGELFVLDERWMGPRALVLPRGQPQVRARAVAAAGQTVRILLLGDGTLIEQSFGIDGSARGISSLPMLKTAADAKQIEWFGVVAAAMLVLVLIGTMRQRAPVTPESLQSAGLTLAPHGRRLLAGAIDALPVIVTMLVMAGRADVRQEQSVQEVAAAMRLPFYISSGIYVGHTTLCEALLGWTIGKRLCRLRVVLASGSPANFAALLVRNLLRVIDVAMIFPLMLVVLSPLRQRVGDVAADTVVVQDSAPGELGT